MLLNHSPACWLYRRATCRDGLQLAVAQRHETAKATFFDVVIESNFPLSRPEAWYEGALRVAMSANATDPCVEYSRIPLLTPDSLLSRLSSDMLLNLASGPAEMVYTPYDRYV